ncbi:MAG: hypothetical protein AB1510_00530 [Bacillota bacterium]
MAKFVWVQRGLFLRPRELGTHWLVLFSPVLLFALVCLGLLAASVLVLLGLCMGLAALAAFLLYELIGLPFWFWMIFTGIGVLVWLVGVSDQLLISDSDSEVTMPARRTYSPLFYLLAGVLIGDLWLDGRD